ncbi:MAG: sigma 54-interacting transcriptional regulator [Desulfobacterales bacterium]|nr:sigma 54-interacting transcriptional regulator [Desulfobacterales bacterium]
MQNNIPLKPQFMMNVFETMRDGIMLMDADGNITYFNKAAEKITEYKREEVIGMPCTVLDTDTCSILTESGRQKCCSLFEGESLSDKKCRIRTKSGRTVYLLKNAVLLKNPDDQIIGAVESITDITSLYMKELELEELKQELRQHYWFMGLLGNSVPMHKLFDKIRNAATSDASVLICGESGTGKELVANAIHQLSSRKEGPFIKMNCASLSEHLMESELFGHKRGSFTGAISDRKGRFEAADKGSIFLDEIGDMPQSMQVKLLRTLEEKVIERVGENTPINIDIRLISATHQDLHDLISVGRFRHDLMYRINSIIIHTPPLREKKDDIPLLVTHHLKKISITNSKDIRGMSSPALEVLESFNWPGNVRQLVNALEHASITCKTDIIDVSDLPDYVFDRNSSGINEQQLEKDNIQEALVMFKGNRTLAAKHLGISRVTLWKRIKDYNIKV